MPETEIAPYVLGTGEARNGRTLNVLGETIHIKLSGADTGGRCAVVEELSQPGAGPPLHIHTREDEWFYILEGTFTFEVDGKRMVVEAGGSVFGPRGIPHTFTNSGDTPARMIVVAEPAGFDRFCERVAELCEAGMPAPEALAPVFEEFGLQIVGPPIGGA